MSTTGQVLPTAAVTAAEDPWLDNDWVSPANIYGAGEASVTAATFDAGDQTYVLKAYTFDFSAIPDGSTIDGVIVTVNARYATAAVSIDLCQLLDVSRAKVGTNKCSTPTALTTSAADYTFGTSSDKWGNSLTAAWVKDADFGVAIGCLAGSTGNSNNDVYIDYVKMEVYYTVGATTYNVTSTMAGTSSATTVGRVSIPFTATDAGNSSATIVGRVTIPFTATMAGLSSLIANHEEAFKVSLSSYIATSGEDTTAQLTPPVGHTTADFVAGRISDDENPLDNINIVAHKYTEIEWSIISTALANTGTKAWEFRVTVSGTPINVYDKTPTLTIYEPIVHNVTATMAGTSSAVTVGTRIINFASAIAGTSSTVTVGRVAIPFISTMSGNSSLTAVGKNGIQFILTMAGSSAVVTVGKNSIPFVSTMAGTSSLVVAGRSSFEFVSTMAGTSAVTASAKALLSFAATMAGSSTLTVAGNRSFAFVSTMAGSSILTVLGTVIGTVDFTATMACSSETTSIGRLLLPLTSTMAGSSILTVNGKRVLLIDAAMAGSSSLTVAGRLALFYIVTMAANSEMVVLGGYFDVGKGIIRSWTLANRTQSWTLSGDRSQDWTLDDNRHLDLEVQSRETEFTIRPRTTIWTLKENER